MSWISCYFRIMWQIFDDDHILAATPWWKNMLCMHKADIILCILSWKHQHISIKNISPISLKIPMSPIPYSSSIFHWLNVSCFLSSFKTYISYFIYVSSRWCAYTLQFIYIKHMICYMWVCALCKHVMSLGCLLQHCPMSRLRRTGMAEFRTMLTQYFQDLLINLP